MPISNIDFGFVSIIMAAFNAEKTIDFAIESVLSQTYDQFELIVINDCSQDNTLKIIESYSEKDKRIKIINNVQNCGVSISRLNGLKAAKGEWIAILDSDDAWMPEKLEKQIMYQKQTNADIIYSGLSFMNSDGEKYLWVEQIPQEVGYRKLLKKNVISNCAALVRKNLFEKYFAIGDEMHEDFAVWLKILKAGYKAAGIDEPLVIIRISRNSKSGNKFKSAIMNWKTYRYVNLDVFSSAYYMIWYTINGIKKYNNLK